MNNDLSLWDASSALPASFEEACRSLERLEQQRTGPSPKFLALGRTLLEPSFGVTRPWAQGLAEQALRWPGAVWSLSLPGDDLVPALRAVIEQANALGLVAFSEPLGAVFLPDGTVLPPEMQEQWAQLNSEADDDEPPLTKSEVRQLTATLLRERLAPQGFLPRAGSEWDSEFIRPTSDGHQSVQMRIRGSSPFFECYLRCTHRSEQVEAIFDQVFGAGVRVPDSFWFHPTAFVGATTGSLPIENTMEIRALLDVVDKYAMPVLDLAKEPGGLDRVMNEGKRFPFDYPDLHPKAAQNLAQEYVSYGKENCLKPLIVAWLAGNPGFETRVADLREFVKGRADVSDAHITRLVEHLARHPRKVD